MPLRGVADNLKNKLHRRRSLFFHTEATQPSQSIPTSPPSTTRRSSHHPPKKLKKEYPPSADTLLNGIGEYLFIDQLGRGKFSRVVLAQHYHTGERFAIKVIDKRIHEYRVMSRLVREVALMEILDHENVVHLYETYETADSLYLVMEYVPGFNLDEYLQQCGALHEDEARLLFRQIVAAVDYCHRRWVVHRDLKAPNILLSPDGHVRLADFGLGNRFGLQRLKTMCGSLLYYSPEIFTGQRYVGPEVDCWCLGVSLFRMTAGFEPFSQAKSLEELKKNVINGHFPMPDHFSAELKATIRKCLVVDRRKRLGVRQALCDDPWLNDGGRLRDLFDDEVDSSGDEQQNIRHYSKWDRERTRRRYLKDMEEEKRRLCYVKKTILYHPINASTYFTSATDNHLHHTYARREEVVQAQEALQKELIKSVRARLQQVQLQPASAARESSPIQRLLGKLKKGEKNTKSKRLKKTTSTMSLSQIYQRVATKDQTLFYTLTPITPPSSDVASLSTLSILTSSSRQQVSAHEYELILLVRNACELLGITFRHETRCKLQCVMTLRNFSLEHTTKHQLEQQRNQRQPLSQHERPDGWLSGLVNRSHHQAPPSANHNQQRRSTPTLTQARSLQQLRHTSLDTMEDHRSSFYTNNSSATSQHRFSRALKRLSMPFQSGNTMLPWSQSLQSSAAVLPQPSSNGVSNNTALLVPANESEEMAAGSTTVFSIEAVLQNDDEDLGSSATAIVGLRFSKIDGSNKVFKYAKGWISGILAYNKSQSK